MSWDPRARVIRSRFGSHLFVVDGSRFYDLPDDLADELEREMGAGATETIDDVLAELTPEGRPFIEEDAIEPPALRAISLNVAQSCNLGCHYCYADKGRFGGKPRSMEIETAKGVVDRLIAESEPGGRIVVGFMGGEPLLNRTLVHAVTHYAAEEASRAKRAVGFSLTTNLTLLRREDAELFRDFGYTVSVSLDGPPEVNDAQRPALGGRGGSYRRILKGLELMDRTGRPAHLSARATVTPRTGPLLPILDHLIGLGFDTAGFSAVTESPDPAYAFGRAEFDGFLREMIRCGERAKAAILGGERYPFSNFETALDEIHRGTHRPYPCGAGAGYLSANAEGRLYACHRFVDDETFAMGDLDGSDRARRADLLTARHVDRQEPCRSCWARYLCGGGCYHEVERNGRLACDYIRGWLEFCLAAYAEITASKPNHFRERMPS